MGKDIRCWLFVGVAFWLGSINVLYHSVFLIFLFISFVVNVSVHRKAFLQHLKKNWRYLMLPIFGVLYLVLHYWISHLGGYFNYRVSWSILELMLLYFFFIPVYIISVKDFMTPRILKYFLLSFCWGILAFNAVKFFYITGTGLFSSPVQTLQEIYNGRMGGNMTLLKGFVLLEPQAFYLAVSAVISSGFLLQCIYWQSWKSTFRSSIIIWLFSLLFLSFTVTKGAILAFGFGLLVLLIVFFRKLSLWRRCAWGAGLVLLLTGAYLGMPDALKERVDEMKKEIIKLQQGQFEGGTVAPRVALWEESFSRIDKWGVWGLGVYEKYGVRAWYEQAQYSGIRDLRNTHNSFLNFWILGGIPGLLFILYYFFAPLLKMIRLKRYSYLLIALLITFVIANSTCFLAGLTDSVPMIVMILALAYLFPDYFIELERETVNFEK